MPGANRAHLLISRKPVVFKSDSFFQAFVVGLYFSAPFPPRLEEGGLTEAGPIRRPSTLRHNAAGRLRRPSDQSISIKQELGSILTQIQAK
jgi:hypothetical protein